MKMTPEQKAFFEYGRAFERVCRRAELLRTARKRCTENPGRYGPEPLIAKVLFDRTINKARQKRAACMAWVPLKERNCNNCMHLHRDMKSGSPCSDCPGIDDEIPSNWEPRKEGE